MRLFPPVRRCPLVALVATIATVALLGTSASAAAAPSSGCSRPPGAQRFFSTFQVDGFQHTALVNLPPNAAPGTALPLVLMFHGAGSTGPETERTIGLTEVADRFGFIVVYPNANGAFWDLAHGPGSENGDIAFVRELLDRLEASLCVDESRVYVAGGSWGGGFATLFGCELSDRIAGIATVAGIYGIEPACQPRRPLPVLEVHGTADSTVPYNGSGRLHAQSVAWFLGQWQAFDSCPAEPAARRKLGRHVVLESWSGCAGGTTVAHVKLVGEQHVWPRPRPQNRVPFDASLALWEFFSTQTVQPDTVPQIARHRRRRTRT